MTNDEIVALRELSIAVLADRLYILGSDQWADPELVARWNADITPTTILELTRELAAALENVKDYKENSALFLRQRDEARTDLAAARALLRDCLPELDGEGVTIHRVWAALAKDAE